MERPVFDELPFVFQARVRDIELELEEGEITQKGFDKRLAKIMHEYRASVGGDSGPASAAAAPKTNGNGAPAAVASHAEAAPVPRVRNGSKKAFYDARKSTVAGFKKPGINFEALLDDLSNDEDDDPLLAPAAKYAAAGVAKDESGSSRASSRQSSAFAFSLGSPLQPAPPVPSLPAASRAPYSASHTGDGDQFDMELSSGRAYNVLSDMMDPYGAQTRGDQQYSDDSSANSILDDIGGPADFNPDIITQGSAVRPHGLAAGRNGYDGDDDDAASVTSSVEVKRMNSLMYPHRRHPPPDAATMPRRDDLRRHISRQNSRRDDMMPPSASAALHSSHGAEPAPIADASASAAIDNGVARDAAVAEPAPAARAPEPQPVLTVTNGSPTVDEPAVPVSLLTPDTPSTQLFVANAFGDEPVLHQFHKLPEVDSGLTPISAEAGSGSGFAGHDGARKRYSSLSAAVASGAARRSRNGTISFADAAENSALMLELLSSRGNRASLQVPASEPRASLAASSNRGSYSHWLDYTAAMEAQSPPAAAPEPEQVAESTAPAEPERVRTADGPLHSDRLAAELELSLGFSESLAAYTQPLSPANLVESPTHGPLDSVCFGGVTAAAGLTVDPLAAASESVSSPQPESVSSPQPESASSPQPVGAGARAVRRPTYGPRADRRPTNSMAVGGGRASYFASEAALEIPANFDMQVPELTSPTIPASAAFEFGVGNGDAAPSADLAAGAYAFDSEAVSGMAVAAPQGGFSGMAFEHSNIETGYGGDAGPEYGDAGTGYGDAGTGYGDAGAGHGTLEPEPGNVASAPGAYALVAPRALPDGAYSSKLQALMAHGNIASVLRHRASATPGAIAYSCVDGKGRETGSWTWAGLHARAIQTAQLLRQRGVAARGERVALVYRKGEVLEFVGSLFGSFYAGLCAVPVVAGDSYAELVHVLGSTGAALVLTTELNIRALNKDLAQNNVGPGWPSVPWVRTDALGGHVLSPAGALNPGAFQARPVAELTYSSDADVHIDEIAPGDCAYIEFSKSPNGELKGVTVTHGAVMRQSAAWMMATGMLDIGRKYKHRVQLDEDDAGADYALALAEPSRASIASSRRSALATPEPPHSPGNNSSSAMSSAPTEPEPRRKWGAAGFLGRLRNVGSLPKMRRASRSRDSATAAAPGSRTRSSLIGASLGSGRLRAASNLSAASNASAAPNLPAAPNLSEVASAHATPSANVAVFKDVVVFYVEPRQHVGLAYGVLGGCYGGHHSVYASSALCDVPGAYVSLLTRYRATVALGDYAGLQAVLAAATDDPREIWEYSKKATPNLARLRLCLVDTLFVDPAFHAAFDKHVLHPFGCPYQAIASTEGHAVVTPVCTLAEHGSALLAMRDCLHAPRGEFVLDRAAFRQNRVVVLPGEKNEAEVDAVGTVRYHAFGLPAPGAAVAVVDPETRELCAADAVGELWLESPALASGFWGLPKLSASIFAARFTWHGADGCARAGAGAFLRTGLMGALVQGQVLVFGFYEDRIRTLTAEPAPGAPAPWLAEPALGFHYAGDINASIRRYLPQVSECAAFELFSNDTHFPVIAAEVRDNSGKYATVAEEIYGVLRSRHGLFAYAVALCRPDTLPRAFQYGKRVVNAQLCRHQFESGRVDCLFVKITTDHLFMNLPPPAFTLAADDVSARDPSVAVYGRWLQQTSLEPAAPTVDEPSRVELSAFATLTDVLVWRAGATPDHVAYAPFDERGRPLKPLSFHKLLVRASAVAALLLDKRRVTPGCHVLLAIAPGPSFAVAVHACLAVGAVPIPVAPPDPERLSDDLPPLLVTAREFRVACIVVDALSEDVFRSKLMEAALRVPSLRALLAGHRMPPVLSVAKASKSPRHLIGRGPLRPDPLWADPARPAIVMLFTGAQASTPQYVPYSHRALLAFCAQQKGDFQMLPTLPVIASVRAYSGYGLLLCAALGVYVGCTTLLLPPSAFFAAPNVWFELVQRHKVKDAFTTLPMLQHAMNYLSAYVGQYAFDLSAVRNFIVAAEERVDPLLYASIRDFFARHRLAEAAINPLYGTLMNPCISTRAYLGVGPLTLRLDIHALRRSKVLALPPLAEIEHPEDAGYSLTLQDSGKVSGSTMVAIVDPVSLRPLPAGCIGEVWVCSSSNALGKQTPAPASAASSTRALQSVADATGTLEGSTDGFVRTGDLGFLYLQVTSDNSAPAEPYLFVAGKISETFNVDGYMYFYSDIERAVAEPSEDVGVVGCVVIQTTLSASPAPDAPTDGTLRLVAVISLRGSPSSLCLPNAACLIFNNVLDRHQVLLDEIVFVPRDALPRSRIAERRRRTVRGMYESGKLDAFVSFPISNSPTLPSGLANPNSRRSLLGPPPIAGMHDFAH